MRDDVGIVPYGCNERRGATEAKNGGSKRPPYGHRKVIGMGNGGGRTLFAPTGAHTGALCYYSGRLTSLDRLAETRGKKRLPDETAPNARRSPAILAAFFYYSV